MRARLVFFFVLAASFPAHAQDPASLRGAIAARYPRVRWVDAPTLVRWMERPLVLLDARTAAEFEVSHLHGARRIDPDRPDVSARYPAVPIVVYCSVGWRSAAVANALIQAGHAEVYNLEGGIFGWANRGRALYRGERRVRVVHPYDALWGRFLDRSLHLLPR
jgi:rhodanese-related sulfurtransferase